MTLLRRLPLLLSTLGVVAMLGVSVQAKPASGIVEGSVSYQSSGHKITVETYLPPGGGRHPAVLVLYGSGGMVFGKGDMNKIARQFAAQGMAAYLVHYFNRTGSIVETGDDDILRQWPEWAQAVRDGVDFVSAQPVVNAKAVGIYGYSLGAFLAIAESVHDKRIRAVVELSGGLFAKTPGHAERFPAMLILHGRDDKRVPVARVPELQQEARRFGLSPETHIYEGEGHQLTPPAAADASSRALKFMARELERS